MSILDVLDRLRGGDETKSVEDLPDQEREFAALTPDLPAAASECPLCDDEGLCSYHHERYLTEYDPKGRCRRCRGTGSTVARDGREHRVVRCPQCGGRGWA